MKSRIASGALLSQRAGALGAILAVHGALAYAMANGMVRAIPRVGPPPTLAVIIPEPPRPLMKRVPVPAPQLQRLRVEIPPPDIEIEIPVDSDHAITDVAIGAFTMDREKALPLPSGPAPKPASRYLIRARIGEHFPNPDAFYPPASIRREEQGMVSVQVCVGVDGRLLEEPTVAKTSGSGRLDDAALKLARSGHYLAGSVDGMPVVDCLQLPIRFKMKS